MPSLAPSCRYGMIEWFQRSMNHDRNSSTVTGQDKKKQGPKEKKAERRVRMQQQLSHQN